MGTQLSDVKSEVQKAVENIKQKYPGGNRDTASSHLEEVSEAIENGNLDRALELAKNSQLAAKPTTDYILSEARKLSSRAEGSFKNRDYKISISRWKEALQAYDRARDRAREGNEEEVLERITENEKLIQENIQEAETAIDNREMLALVKDANGQVEVGNDKFNGKDFDSAINSYQQAENSFNKAMELAEKREFEEDAKKIREGLDTISTSVESCRLANGEAFLNSSDETLNKGDLEKAEKEFKEALEYLEGLKELSRTEELEGMKEKAKEGIVKSRVEQGSRMMEEAESHFNKDEYYEAREAYRKARDLFEDISDTAVEYGLTAERDRIRDFIRAANQNMTAAADASIGGVGSVEADIVGVDSVARAGADFSYNRASAGPFMPPEVEKLSGIYRNIRLLGQGGFANVYRAETQDGGKVALKVPRELTDRGEKLFFRELVNWKRLDHRNIVKLIEPKVTPVAHLKVEYADRGSIFHIMKREGSFSIDESCRIAFDIARGLEFAHSKHLVHGDVNPKNILLTAIDEAKITDFGLAKISTSSSEVKGYTLTYAAKEQVEENKATEKTDVYQLGLTLYSMLTGANPFDAGSRFDTEENIRNLEPEPLSSYNPGAGELDDIVMRCLHKTPKKRPTLREFREHLYLFMKRNYSTSLHLTEDNRTIVDVSCSAAFMAAKQKDIPECRNNLELARRKVKDSVLREDLGNLIRTVEYYDKEDLPLNELLGDMEKLLKKVRFGG